MSNPYIQSTPEQIEEMLQACSAKSIDSIFDDQIPSEFQFKSSHNLPPALSEPELQIHLLDLAGQNSSTNKLTSFLGGGIYDHYVPSAIMHVANRSEYVTGYTPYQPEASQGLLQAFFEYQSLISRLYDMPVSNASLYDCASALGEAVFMALGIKTEATRVIISETIHPDYRELLATYLAHFDVKIDTIPQKNGQYDQAEFDKALGSDVAAVVVQHPNYFGCLEEVHDLSKKAKDAGALLIAISDPLSLGVLAPPGSYNADIAIGEGQPLGLNQYAGGETIGIFTCQKDFIRKVPGRLVGLAKDKTNRDGFVLTLQTREQHIRRAKATSNICTNHAHNALRATIYMCLMGPQGVSRVARACVRNTERLKAKLQAKSPNCIPFNAAVFKEFVVKLNANAETVCDELLQKGFLAGIPLSRNYGQGYDNYLLVSVTEKRTDKQIDAFAEALEKYL